MKIDTAVRDRAKILIKRGRILAQTSDDKDHPAWSASLSDAHGWLASAHHLIKVIYPDPLSAYSTRAAIVVASRTTSTRVASTVSILEHLLEDIDAGVIATVADAARAEVFDDFLDQAEYYLNGKRLEQSGVIAGVVFEDTIRKACERRRIPQKGVELEQLITELRKADAFNELKAKRSRAAAAVRTKATHAQWDEFDLDDVRSTIKLTRELIESLLV